MIGDEAALTEWKANAGARPQLSHEYDANHRCKNCHDIDPTYQLSREDALALVKGVYKSGSDTFDFASTSDAVAKNGDTLYTVNELKFYRIDNTIYVIYGGSSHAKMATFTLNGDNKVTSVSTYDMMTEETTGTYAPEHTHKGVKQNGQAATKDAAGFHEYYYCEGCDTYFEDENCTKTIGGAAALTTWKSEGTGYIPPTCGGNDPKNPTDPTDPTDPDPKDDDDDKGGLSTGAIVGIVIGAVVVVGAAGFLIWFFLFFKKKNDDDDEPTDPNGDTPNDDTPNDDTPNDDTPNDDASNGGENE